MVYRSSPAVTRYSAGKVGKRGQWAAGSRVWRWSGLLAWHRQRYCDSSSSPSAAWRVLARAAAGAEQRHRQASKGRYLPQGMASCLAGLSWPLWRARPAVRGGREGRQARHCARSATTAKLRVWGECNRRTPECRPPGRNDCAKLCRGGTGTGGGQKGQKHKGEQVWTADLSISETQTVSRASPQRAPRNQLADHHLTPCR